MVNKYRQHAIERMFERGITEAAIDSALSNGQAIENYPNDYPLPSGLWLGDIGERPIHILFADNHRLGERIMITVTNLTRYGGQLISLNGSWHEMRHL